MTILIHEYERLREIAQTHLDVGDRIYDDGYDG